MNRNVLICGATQGIGLALCKLYLAKWSNTKVFATYRNRKNTNELEKLNQIYPDRIELLFLDAERPETFSQLAELIQARIDTLDTVINCIGVLSLEKHLPEKKIEEVDINWLHTSIQVNAVTTLLLAQRLKNPLLNSTAPALVSLSAKVGSITDNKTGGWYSYRISKAALNMVIKNISIEFNRMNKKACVFAIHPGTTETQMTQNFLSNARKKYTIHSADETAQNIMSILSDEYKFQWNGQFISWDQSLIDW